MKQQRSKPRVFFLKQKGNRNKNSSQIKFQQMCHERKGKLIRDLNDFPGKISMNLGCNHGF